MTALASQLMLVPPHLFLVWLFWRAQPQPTTAIRVAVIAGALSSWILSFGVVFRLSVGYGQMWTLIATTVAGYLAFTAALALGYELSRR